MFFINLCLIVSFSSGIVSDVLIFVFNGFSLIVEFLVYVFFVYLFVFVLYCGWKYCCLKDFDGYYEGKSLVFMIDIGVFFLLVYYW